MCNLISSFVFVFAGRLAERFAVVLTSKRKPLTMCHTRSLPLSWHNLPVGQTLYLPTTVVSEHKELAGTPYWSHSRAILSSNRGFCDLT